ncbi:MAG: CRISPR-associated protein Cas4 [Acidobacteriia bacterium]|nr:CRISPR-associated protein Cas4 [Terriglobia bacterium]
MPLSLLNDFLYCQRRAALKAVEGQWGENVHTIRGDLAHEHADLPGYEVAKGVKLLRALPVFSERLGLSGKCDIVERYSDGSLSPVEYKKGKRRQFENDDAQLCAQALCLEEMFGRPVKYGAVFHAASKRRREVEFTAELRKTTEDAVAELHQLVETGTVPLAVFKPACEECSLYRICLPQITSRPGSLARAAEDLYRT